MAGYSDVPYRALCRAYGSAMHYTEFVPADQLLTRRPNRYWQLLDFQADESPRVFQIFHHDPQVLLAAAQRIEEWGPDIIDVNMGCSTRRVSGRGAGVGLMRSPERIAETFRLLSTHLSVPVTGKIRLGWDDQVNYLEVARIMEDNGAALVAMHGRTKEQKYAGAADWDALARLRDAVSIPVIGNGDVHTPADIDRLRNRTGVAAVMVGRGAIGNPWIFERRGRDQLAFPELTATVRLHLREMLAYYGDYGLIKFRKHLDRYLHAIPLLANLLQQMKRAREPQQLLDLLAEADARCGRRRVADLQRPLLSPQPQIAPCAVAAD
jgi:nifR3 family TIM-barrel protein